MRDLLADAEPVIRRCLARRRGMYAPDDFDDLHNEVLMRLVRRLGDRDAAPIEQFDDYVAMVTYHAVDDYVRKRGLPRDDEATAPDAMRVVDASAARRVEALEICARLWSEIRELPPRQRVALLLHLRDESGETALAHFVISAVASPDELAASMGMTRDELLALWDELPLDDHRIAARLGATRQQVINLRKSARERLGRRMAAW
ncbi:MAG TPA: sigma-70 family RNA polymerase sigma factor [Thermoanaerobaculia bacterium]